jgi:hypothetical protein
LAEAFDALIGFNYRPMEVWAMTPRQIAASLKLASKRHRRELAEQLNIQTLAARGDPNAVEKQFGALIDEP